MTEGIASANARKTAEKRNFFFKKVPRPDKIILLTATEQPPDPRHFVRNKQRPQRAICTTGNIPSPTEILPDQAVALRRRLILIENDPQQQIYPNIEQIPAAIADRPLDNPAAAAIISNETVTNVFSFQSQSDTGLRH